MCLKRLLAGREGLIQISRYGRVIVVLCSLFLADFLIGSAYAQLVSTPTIRHMQSALLPIAAPGSSFQNTVLPARYDQQLGMTFVEDFVSLAYNVTAVDQTDPYGYGPAYLLNGLSNRGYWYQVGLSYNWPYAGISGYNQGFAFNYQVFAPNQSAVYPRNGGGGLQAFSGPVNSGDKVLLVLSFYEDVVVMYAEDWNTSAYAMQVFSAEGAEYFEGSPYEPANYNGFFTGLMTEWYHPQPYYGDQCKATYSNDDFALSAAWMWMDEYDPYNYSWTGAWFSNTVGPVDFSQNSTQLHSFTFGGIIESCNAYEFNTGSIIPLPTSITLIPASQTVPLSGSNDFAVWYVLHGRQMATHARGGTLTLSADNGTYVVVSGISSGSSSTESWVLNSHASNVTVASGSDVTSVYYDLLAQLASYTVSGGGNPPDVTITYYTAPEDASSQHALTRMDVSIPSSTYQTIMVARGSTVSMPSSISNNSQERWAMNGSSTWTITSANQMPARIVYQRQFLLSFAGAQLSWQWINAGTTTEVTLLGVSERTAGSGQRVTSYTVDDAAPTFIQPTTGMVTIPIFMNSPHKVSINLIKQFQMSLNVSIAKNVAYITPPTINDDDYWYDQGTAVKLVLKSVLDRVSGVGERLESYSVSGVVTNVAEVNPITVLNLSAISSPETVNGKTIGQHQINITSGFLASITDPPIPGDAGWYDAGSLVTAVFNYSWNYIQEQSRTNAIGYAISEGGMTSLNRLGNGTFPVQITVTAPRNVSIYSVTQHVLSFSGGFNVVPSNISPTKDSFFDAGTYVTLATDSTWKLANESTKQRITGYTLDGTETNFNGTETAKLTTSEIYFDSPHELVFKSITIVPSLLTLEVPANLVALTLIIAIVIIVTVAVTLIIARRGKLDSKRKK